MPGRNNTGPLWVGPRTGWGMGNCAPTTEQQAENVQPAGNPPEYGRGLGLRRGFRPCGRRPRGRGRRQ